MKKLLFVILAWSFVNVAVAESLPRVNTDGSYNDIMNSQVRMDAIHAAMNLFPVYTFHGEVTYGKTLAGSDVGSFLKSYVYSRVDLWYEIERDGIAKDLWQQLREKGNITLRVLEDVCMLNAYKVPFATTTAERDSALKRHTGAVDTCDVFVQAVVRLHNELVAKDQPVLKDKIEVLEHEQPQRKKLFGIL